MDGTLYSFDKGSFDNSGLRKKVEVNALKYIIQRLEVSKEKAHGVFNNLRLKYSGNISIGLEKDYNIDRYDYFNTVWNIPAKGFVKKSGSLKKILNRIKNDYDIMIVSDAPRVWIDNVLMELDLSEVFADKIFSGEGDRRKSHKNVFDYVAQQHKYPMQNCIVVGDQEETDIFPAKICGMKTIFVNSENKSSNADYWISDIFRIEKALKEI